MDGTITTSTGTSTSGGADIHITSVERLYPISVVDYNDARAGLVELQEPRNDNKPISQSISEVISDVKNYQPTYNSNHDEEAINEDIYDLNNPE